MIEFYIFVGVLFVLLLGCLLLDSGSPRITPKQLSKSIKKGYKYKIGD